MITFLSDKLDFCDVQLRPGCFPLVPGQTPPSSRAHIDLMVEDRVPLIVANMDHLGTFNVARVASPLGLMVAILKDFSADDWKRELEDGAIASHRLMPTVGLRDLDSDIQTVREITAAFPTIDTVCLDVANGYLHAAADAVKRLKDTFPALHVCGGNVVTPEGVSHLAEAGASIVKVGIGSGGVCLTRRMTGIGCPQFSAVHDVAQMARDLNVRLISDGGITNSGDAMKAFAAGASFVMVGSLFAGHDETGVEFHGMSSHLSRRERGQKKESYRASEGREVILEPRGPLANTIQEFLGGLTSSCMYLGIRRLGDVPFADIPAFRVFRQLNRVQGVGHEL